MSEENAWRKQEKIFGIEHILSDTFTFLGTMRVQGKIGMMSEEEYNSNHAKQPN